MYAVESDYELLDAWGAGDRRAGSKLFRRYFPVVFRFYKNKVSNDVEDLVQKAFLACVESRDKFRRDASFKTFLLAVARNVLYNEYRRKRRKDDPVDFLTQSVIDIAPSPSLIVAERAEQRLLLEALRSIPIDYQIALELYLWEELTGPELGEVLGMSEAGARSRLHRARTALRKAMESLERSPERLESTMSDLEGWAAGIRAQLER